MNVLLRSAAQAMRDDGWDPRYYNPSEAHIQAYIEREIDGRRWHATLDFRARQTGPGEFALTQASPCRERRET